MLPTWAAAHGGRIHLPLRERHLGTHRPTGYRLVGEAAVDRHRDPGTRTLGSTTLPARAPEAPPEALGPLARGATTRY